MADILRKVYEKRPTVHKRRGPAPRLRTIPSARPALCAHTHRGAQNFLILPLTAPDADFIAS